MLLVRFLPLCERLFGDERCYLSAFLREMVDEPIRKSMELEFLCTFSSLISNDPFWELKPWFLKVTARTDFLSALSIELDRRSSRSSLGDIDPEIAVFRLFEFIALISNDFLF